MTAPIVVYNCDGDGNDDTRDYDDSPDEEMLLLLTY